MGLQYDIFVVGAGAAGLSAAFTAAGFGRKVAIAEMDKPGGECTHYGCVPSKALLYAAEKGMPDPFGYVRSVIERVYAEESFDVLEKRGIKTFRRQVRLLGENRIDIGSGETATAKKIYLCTGSSPAVPSIKGLDRSDFLTNETVFSLKKAPSSMIIVGGGAVACEMACAFNRLGAKVTMLVRSKLLRTLGDREIAEMVKEDFRSREIDVREGATPVSAVKDGSLRRITLSNGESAEAESVLAAVGRSPRVAGMGLEECGVKYDADGIKTDAKLRTSVRNIFAAGDVAGPYRLSHAAGYQGIKSALNGMLPLKSRVDYRLMGWTVFTFPQEIAHLGASEPELTERNKPFDTCRVRISEIDRAAACGSGGLLKIRLCKKGRILGASLYGERAGEMIHILQLAMMRKIPLHALDGMMFYYPTFCDAIKKAAREAKKQKILNHPLVRLAGKFRK